MASKSKSPFMAHISYRAYMIWAFAMVAAATAIAVISMVAFVFNMYFTSYTSENMESVADFAATRISEEYAYMRNLNTVNYESIINSLRINEDAGIMVLDSSGGAVFDSSDLDGNGNETVFSGPDSASQVAMASITYNGEIIGSVRIWMYGSDVLMSKLDISFRNSTYEALVLAGLVAVVFSTLIGYVFSRSLVKPIDRITGAARKISEGDLTARTNMKGKNEFGRLGETFDNMAESIEKDRQMEVRLTSDVAHELRTPLMAIQATVEAMMDGVYETDSEHLALVDGEVRRLSRLVDALLKLTRLERRSEPLKEEVIDLGETVEAIVASHEVFVQDTGLEIEAHVDGIVKAVCDRDKIRQAVANLVSNAVRYTPEGGRIDVYVKKLDDKIAIEVKDTGIGLSPEEEKMVFSRFWRADSGRKHEGGGLGIGLTMVKEIVDQHHGEIKVRGEKGVGSTFTILLPAYDEDASRSEARAAIRAFERRVRQPSKQPERDQ